MLHYALVFLMVALVAAVYGFAGVAAGTAEVAKIVFVIFLVLFVGSLVGHLLRPRWQRFGRGLWQPFLPAVTKAKEPHHAYPSPIDHVPALRDTARSDRRRSVGAVRS
jgi:uncharacterized membrane protein YtjA (UPF0391 family)